MVKYAPDKHFRINTIKMLYILNILTRINRFRHGVPRQVGMFHIV